MYIIFNMYYTSYENSSQFVQQGLSCRYVIGPTQTHRYIVYLRDGLLCHGLSEDSIVVHPFPKVIDPMGPKPKYLSMIEHSYN